MENKLKEILEGRGIKQVLLADKAGINRNTIAGMIAGNTPKIDVAYRIANILDLKVEDIWINDNSK